MAPSEPTEDLLTPLSVRLSLNPRTRTTATRVRILILTPTGADGWIGATRHLVATLTLTGRGAGSDR